MRIELERSIVRLNEGIASLADEEEGKFYEENSHIYKPKAGNIGSCPNHLTLVLSLLLLRKQSKSVEMIIERRCISRELCPMRD